MAKDCQRPKKEKNTWKCYECGRTGYITGDYRTKQKMKKQSVQENKDIDTKEVNK